MISHPRPVAPAAVLTSGGYRVFPVDAIQWVESNGNRVHVQVADAVIPVRATLRETMDRLGPGFRQVHRRYVVNLAHITAIRPNGDGTWVVLTTSGAELPVGRSYRAALFAALTTL